MSIGDSFDLEGFLRLNTEGFDQASRKADNLGDAAEDAGESVESGLSERLASAGKRMQGVGTAMTAGITLPIVAVGAKSIQTASRVEEMRDKTEAVFGDLTEEVRAFADETADSLNRSANELEGMATNFADLLVPMGASRDQAADLSKELTVLTQDLSSFNNLPAEQVQKDLQSALTGSAETMKKYGVDVRQSAVNQELLNMGIEGGAEAASRMEVAQARLNIIMDETADAQGNAEETSDSFANQMRGLKASVEDLQVEIGQHLLPAAKDLVGVVDPAVSAFGRLSDRQQKVAIAAGGLAAAIGPLLLGVGTLLAMLPAMIAGFGTLTAVTLPISAPILAIVAAVGALSAGLAALSIKSGWIQPMTIAGNIAEWVSGRFDWVRNNLDKVALALGPVGLAALALNKIWTENIGGIQEITATVVEQVTDSINFLIEQVNRIEGVDIPTIGGGDGGAGAMGESGQNAASAVATSGSPATDGSERQTAGAIANAGAVPEANTGSPSAPSATETADTSAAADVAPGGGRGGEDLKKTIRDALDGMRLETRLETDERGLEQWIEDIADSRIAEAGGGARP